MSTVISSNKHYKSLAAKIRAVLGTVIKYKPSEMPQAIRRFLDEADDYSAITNGVVYYSDNARIVGTKMYPGAFAGSGFKNIEIPESITSISDYAFYYSDIETVTLHDNITSIGGYAFFNCYKLTELDLPDNLKSIGQYCFSYMVNISDPLVLPGSVTDIGYQAFSFTNFIGVDIPSGVSYIETAAFYYSKLRALVLRRTASICTVSTSGIVGHTPIENGNGYIYVPSALIDTYKANANWATYANQFRALEDYTVDGTVTGEFDFSKI